jgi:hypothetical protein
VLLAIVAQALRFQVGLGTVFGPSAVDRWNPRDVMACRYPERLTKEREGVAHPSLPCGSMVTVCVVRTGKCIKARVVDRGPRSALVDLSMATARKLGWGERGGFSGRERVLLIQAWGR